MSFPKNADVFIPNSKNGGWSHGIFFQFKFMSKLNVELIRRKHEKCN